MYNITGFQRNVTLQHDFIGEPEKAHYEVEAIADHGQVFRCFPTFSSRLTRSITVREFQANMSQVLTNPEVGTMTGGYTFWESVLVFPLIAVFCIVLVLVLSLIFFGRREGQQWRDYKTAK